MTVRRRGLVDRALDGYGLLIRRWRRKGALPDRADAAEALDRNGLPRLVAAGVAVVGVGALFVALGIALPAHVQLGMLAAVAVFLVGATTISPMAVPVLTMPLLVVVQRIGGGGVDLSISDFVLFGAFWICVVLGHRPYSRSMRALLWVSLAYQLATAFTVLANHDSASIVEWFHAWLLVAGAIVVG
ncbi:MAG TPA: hypothetical protein VGC04_03550, partial [Cellulomonas sp.]